MGTKLSNVTAPASAARSTTQPATKAKANAGHGTEKIEVSFEHFELKASAPPSQVAEDRFDGGPTSTRKR